MNAHAASQMYDHKQNSLWRCEQVFANISETTRDARYVVEKNCPLIYPTKYQKIIGIDEVASDVYIYHCNKYFYSVQDKNNLQPNLRALLNVVTMRLNL